jgi:hypothetical protein
MSFNLFENTLDTAKGLNITANTQTANDSLGAFEQDIYSFTLNHPSNFNLNLDELSADANVQIISDRNSNGIVDSDDIIAGSYHVGTQQESLATFLDSGTYYIQVNSFGQSNDYNLKASAQSANSDIDFSDNGIKNFLWAITNLKDAELTQKTIDLSSDGDLSRDDMIAIFHDTKDGSVVDANELIDLRTIVSNASQFNMKDYVRVLSDKVVNGNIANANYQGQALGNLYAGSSDRQIEALVDKWFFGGDRPIAASPDNNTNYSYQKASGSLFKNGVSYQDIDQGNVANCYFLAALGAVAFRSPETIKNMFIDNGDDTYTVRFYNNGVADYVTVDKYLPTNASGKLVYANEGQSPTNSELWVALAEKGYAQINESAWLGRGNNANSYQAIGYGYDYQVVNQVTGKISNFENFNFNSMVNKFQNGSMMNVSSKADNYQVASNIVANHVYTIVDYSSSTQKFTLFNPWGVNGQSGKPGLVQLSFDELQQSFFKWSST